MNRTQRILAAVLAVQIVLSVVTLWPRAARSDEGTALFPDLQAADVVALSIADNDGNSIQMRRVDGSWVLPDADDYPARTENIAPVLDKIVALDTRRLVTRTASSHKRLQVAAESFVRRLDLETAGGTKHTLYLGSSPSYGATHMRVEGRDETYLASNMTAWEFGTAPPSWIDNTYFSVAQDQLSAITVQNARGTLTFNRDAEGNWTLVELPVGEELAVDTVKQVVDRATSVTLLRPLGKASLPDYGMDNPLAVVTLQPKEGQPITLRIGAQDARDQSYAVHVSTSPYYVRVSEYFLQALVENGVNEFLVPEVTPTPES